MPGGDGSGPMGRGPTTGGGFGPCGGGPDRRSVARRDATDGAGFGRSTRRRSRRWSPAWSGWRHRWWNRGLDRTTDEIDLEVLRRREQVLETELAHLRSRLAEIADNRET